MDLLLILLQKTIIYPCSRFKCAIPCPCMLCAKKHPTCRVPSTKSCSCQDCSSQFADHKSYHAVFHYGCRSCFQLIKSIPNLNYFFLDIEKKIWPSGCYDSNSPLTPMFCQPGHQVSVDFLQKWCRKRDKWKSGQEDADDLWCKGCNTLFWNLDDLKEHLQKRHKVSKVFWHHWQNTAEREDCSTKCYQCAKNFASVKDLLRHIDSIHYQETHEFDVCEDTFTRKDALRRHKSVKHKGCTSDFNLSCKECGKQFTRWDHLKRHKDGAHKYVCDQCEEKFCTAAFLKEHSNALHGEIKEENSCVLCPTTCQSTSDLKEHIKSVHKEKVFKCLFCPKTFLKKGHFENHKLLYHKKNSFGLKCLRCNSNFKNKFCLERHQKEVRIGDSPQYNCEKCNIIFCTGKLLRTHVNSMHTTSSSCDLCDQKFRSVRNLEAHVEKRMKKPEHCQKCGKLFCNPSSLKTHMQKEHS